jgi:hypothetical protein
MPTCRRKRVLLTEPSQDILDSAQSDANREVYYLAQTGEIFDSYEYVCPLCDYHYGRAFTQHLLEHMLPV